jgi:hypothetical protein
MELTDFHYIYCDDVKEEIVIISFVLTCLGHEYKYKVWSPFTTIRQKMGSE